MIVKCDQLGREPEKNKFYPKRYLYDVGILTQLRLKGMSEISLADLALPALRTPLGGLIENAVALSLKVQFGDDLFGLKIGPRAEIDFAVKHEGQVYPIECKISMRFKENYLTGLKIYLKEFQKKKQGFLFYGGPPQRQEVFGVRVLPYYLADELKRLLPLLAD